MKTLNLIMLRHGLTEHNAGLRLTGWGDPELNETGHSQAAAVASKLAKEFTIEAIFASPLTRTTQTASYLAKAIELPVKYDEGLKELNFGEMEGFSIVELRANHPEMYQAWRGATDPHFGWPGGETRLAFHTRVDQAIWRVIAESIAQKFETVAVVAHGGALAGFVSEILVGMPYRWRDYLLENCEYYMVAVDYDETKLVEKGQVGLRVVSIGKTVPIGPNS